MAGAGARRVQPDIAGISGEKLTRSIALTLHVLRRPASTVVESSYLSFWLFIQLRLATQGVWIASCELLRELRNSRGVMPACWRNAALNVDLELKPTASAMSSTVLSGSSISAANASWMRCFLIRS